MSLDAELGTGAKDALLAALSFEDNVPVLLVGDWEDVPQAPIQVSGLDIQLEPADPWPGAGVWQSVLVTWNDATVQILFKDGVMFWGNGICSTRGGDPGERYSRLGNQRMWDFLSEFTTIQRIDLPNVPEFYEPFLKGGFEVFEVDGTLARLRSVNSRIFEWIQWQEAGSDPEQEPEWRRDV